MNTEILCMGCMRDKGDARVCDACGFEEGSPPERPGQLSPRTILAEKYVIGRVLGQGGFGITYLAWDLILDRKLAIKEHFPREICTRSRDERTVQPLTQRLTEDYRYGLKKFVEEGRALACFYDHPGIVLLLDFLEANGTAYLVMAYVAGMTFGQYLKNHAGKIGFGPAIDILTPVMDSLREVHRMGMLHRDVSPDNIYINEKKEVKILDFGSTRYAVREFSQMPAVKPGYSPFEQYGQSGKQGTWTDVYATAATLYRAITGQAPPEAPDRYRGEVLIPPSHLGVEISPSSEKALLKALSVQPKDRFQTIDHFWNALVPPPPEPPPPTPNGSRWFLVLLIVACVLLLSTAAFATMWMRTRHNVQSIGHTPDESLALRSQIDDLKNKLAARQKSFDDQLAQGTALQTKVSNLEQQNQVLNARLEATRGERTALTTERDSLKAQLKTDASNNQNLQAQIGGLQQLIKSLQDQSGARRAVSLRGYRLFYWDGEWDLKRSKYKIQADGDFDGNTLRYILCEVSGPNPLPGKQYFSAAIDVRYFGPDNQFKRMLVGGVAPTGTTEWNAYSGWGSDRPGTFKRGEWTVQVWCEGQKLGEMRFRVH